MLILRVNNTVHDEQTSNICILSVAEWLYRAPVGLEISRFRYVWCFYSLVNKHQTLGPVNAKPKKIENEALFLRLSLLCSLIQTEN